MPAALLETPAPLSRARLHTIAFALILGAFALFHLSHLDFVPIWDSAQYAECLIDGAEQRSLAALNCFGHPSALYLLPLALGQMLFPGSSAALVVCNLLFGLGALLAFRALAVRLLPDEEGRTEALLATACLAALPVVNGNLLEFSPDFGVYALLLPVIWAHVTGRRLLALVFGTMLVFSKESGVILEGLTLAGLALVFGWGRVRRDTLWPLVRRHAIDVLPLVLIAGFLLVRMTAAPEQALWQGTSVGSIASSLVRFDFDRHLASFAAGLGVMNFAWLGSLALLAGAVRRGLRGRGVLPEGGDRLRLFVVLLLVAGFLVLTRFKTYAHLRYVLALFPLFLLAMLISLRAALPWRYARQAALAIVLVLLAISNVRTVDPVSRQLYGTFEFGDHELLRVTSIARQCCGAGLDGLTYNTEYTHLTRLSDRIYRELQPGPQDVVAFAHYARWYVLLRLDALTFERTLRRVNSFLPPQMGVPDEAPLPSGVRRILFVEFPNMPSGEALKVLRARYPLREVRNYEEQGYRMRVALFDGT